MDPACKEIKERFLDGSNVKELIIPASVKNMGKSKTQYNNGADGTLDYIENLRYLYSRNKKIPLAYKMPKRIQTNVKVLIKAQRYYITQKTKCNNHLTKKYQYDNLQQE